MPITQDRMVSVIEAAYAYRDAYLTILQEFDNILADISTRRLDVPTARTRLTFQMNQLSPTVEQIEALAREREHFRIARHRNEVAKRRMARLRGTETREGLAPMMPKPQPSSGLYNLGSLPVEPINTREEFEDQNSLDDAFAAAFDEIDTLPKD